MTAVSDEEFARIWRSTGGRAAQVAEITGASIRNAYRRRNVVEHNLNIQLPSAGDGNGIHRGDAGVEANDYLQRVPVDGFAGTVVVFSDCHYWPDQGPSVAHRALVDVVRDIRPQLIVANGDIFDGARLSRFPRNGWEEQPRVVDELHEATQRLSEIRHAYLGARLIRTIGNHCIRFDRFLAVNAGDMEGVAGMRLSDHMPEWHECVSVFINGNTMIKHRYKGGVHAAFNNVRDAGTNFVSGHTHHLEVKPWGDYRGRRYGVQTGAIAEVNGPQFAYTEDNPTPWCSGFAVLTFSPEGKLLPPELAEVIEGKCYFRGQVVA